MAKWLMCRTGQAGGCETAMFTRVALSEPLGKTGKQNACKVALCVGGFACLSKLHSIENVGSSISVGSTSVIGNRIETARPNTSAKAQQLTCLEVGSFLQFHSWLPTTNGTEKWQWPQPPHAAPHLPLQGIVAGALGCWTPPHWGLRLVPGGKSQSQPDWRNGLSSPAGRGVGQHSDDGQECTEMRHSHTQ
jgi:hypothetical protein